MARGRKQPSAPEEGVVAGLTHEGEGVVRGLEPGQGENQGESQNDPASPGGGKPASKTAFIGGALPGERIRFQRLRQHRGHDEGLLLEVLESSPDRVTPRCAHFGTCGGCALQHLDESRQIEFKSQELAQVLQRVARVEPAQWLPPLRGPGWAYRRRARLGARYVHKKGRVVVGFRERMAPYVAALDRCEVLAEPAGSLITPLSQLLTGLSIREHVPQIEVAVAENATALVLRVMRPPSEQDLQALRAFEAEHGLWLYLQPKGLESVRRLAPVGNDLGATDPDLGPPLRYTFPQFGVAYDFRPTDFVQVNAATNQAMVSRVIDLLQLTPDARVLDLFCGLGNFSLPLARHASEVVGVEGDAALVERAQHNAALNGLENAHFVVADLTKPLPLDVPWFSKGFSHVVLDPPRAGALEVLPTIAQLSPRLVVYISCHPGSLARDIGVLVHDYGFALRAAGVMDMFPHTTHVESLAVLTPPAGKHG